MNNYLFTFDTSDGRISNEQMVAFISQNRFVDSWANPFVGGFLFKSDHDLKTVRASIHKIMSGVGHLVASVNITTVGGSLPNSVWDWFNTGILDQEGIAEVRKEREQRFIALHGHANYKEV